MVYNNLEGQTFNNQAARDPAAQIATEIFQHDLQSAARDTNALTRSMSAQDAQQFVARVNADITGLQNQNGFYGDQNSAGNYLDIRPMQYGQYGQNDSISLVRKDSTGNIVAHREVAEVPIYPPSNRVPMQNFQQYQLGEAPAPNYFGPNQVNGPWNAWNASYQQSWQPPVTYPPYSPYSQYAFQPQMTYMPSPTYIPNYAANYGYPNYGYSNYGYSGGGLSLSFGGRGHRGGISIII